MASVGKEQQTDAMDDTKFLTKEWKVAEAGIRIIE